MIDDFFAADFSIAILVIILLIAILRLGIKVVPQSEVFVIERFGKYARTLNAGLSLIVPILDRVASPFVSSTSSISVMFRHSRHGSFSG